MKLKTNTKTNKGFTLIEMIGVLAVIAILAAVLIPKVFEAINNSRINNAAMSCQTVKTAIADHYAKFGSLLSTNGTVIASGSADALAFDRILMGEGFLDKPFATKIATTNHCRVVTCTAAATADPSPATTWTSGTAAYNLDGAA